MKRMLVHKKETSFYNTSTFVNHRDSVVEAHWSHG